MNYVSAGGIIWHGDKICFICWPSNKVSFPKGTREEGETIEQTAVREVQEETGLKNPKIVKKLGILTRIGHNHEHQPVMKDIHLFLMTVDNFTQGNADEITKWLTVEEALPQMHSEEADFLKSYLESNS